MEKATSVCQGLGSEEHTMRPEGVQRVLGVSGASTHAGVQKEK